MLATHTRELESVEVRHTDIDENQRNIVLQQTLECLVRRGRLDQGLADLRENDLIAQQLCLLVVDQQDVHLVGLAHKRNTGTDSIRLSLPSRCAAATQRTGKSWQWTTQKST